MQITNAQDALRYMLAGNATVTLASARTGTRYTYRVRAAKDARGDVTHFISVLTGSDNTRDYSYLGVVGRDGVRTTQRSTVGPDAPSTRAIQWALRKLQEGQLPTELEVHHSGRCGRCGRELTVPESIRTGLGPTCAGAA